MRRSAAQREAGSSRAMVQAESQPTSPLGASPAGIRHDTGPDDARPDDDRRGAWMAAAQAGDQAAYGALLRDCVGVIEKVARRQGVPADRTDDVVQDALLTDIVGPVGR